MERDGSIDFSLTRGGPSYRLLVATRLVRDGHAVGARAAFALAVVTWVPLVLIALIDRAATGRPALLLTHPAVHVRAFVAIPLLVATERLLEIVCGEAMQALARSRVAGDGAGLARVARAGERLRDAVLPEALLLAATLTYAAAVRGAAGEAPWPSLTRAYYAFVSLTVYRFLMLRALWRWVIWAEVLRKVARLPLVPVPTHPDRSGGLAILAQPTAAFALLAAAGSTVVAATWGEHIAAGTMTFDAYARIVALFVVCVVVIAFAPLLPLLRHLFRARRLGLMRYGALASIQARQFDERWAQPPRAEAELLRTSDASSLADLSTVYGVVKEMRTLPFGARAVVTVVLGALLPMLPLVATVVPLPELAQTLGRALLGGGLPR